MNRADLLRQSQDRSICWDLLVIGGGATGLGCAVDAAARGYRTLLIEQADFAQGTSSRSTKLIHGGFRYLKQGNLSLVRHSLRERGLLLRNAPHLVHSLSFVLPCYAWWERAWYGTGLKLYDLLAGPAGLGPCRALDRQETLAQLPTLEPNGLRGGIGYSDGQFDDARLALGLAWTLHDLGGVPLNHVAATALLQEKGRIIGAKAQDRESLQAFEIRAKAVINATGIFVDQLRRLDHPQAAPKLTLSQGTHLVLPKKFLPGPSALMVPKTDDGRVLFAIPWQDRLLLGTTDTPVPQPILEPKPFLEEISFLLRHAARFLTQDPAPEDILCVFSGLRPLISANPETDTSRIARDHVILVSGSGLVTVTGGKWTTYRQMAQATVDQAIKTAGLAPGPCRTRSLRLHGWMQPSPAGGAPAGTGYGADWQRVEALAEENPDWRNLLHPRLPYCRSEVVWAAREEMARTVEDVLARRTRALFLDAQAALEAAPATAALLAAQLGRDRRWERDQIGAFTRLARHYLPGGLSVPD